MGAWYNPYTGAYGRGYGGLRSRTAASAWARPTTRGPAPTRAAPRRMVPMDRAPPVRPTTRAPAPTRRRARARTSTATGAPARCSAATTGRRPRTARTTGPERTTIGHPDQRRRRCRDRRSGAAGRTTVGRTAGRRRLRRPRRQRLSPERRRRLGAEQRVRRLERRGQRQSGSGSCAGPGRLGRHGRHHSRRHARSGRDQRRNRPAGTRQQRADLGQHPHRRSQRMGVERRIAFRCRQLRRQSRGRRARRWRSKALRGEA